ncbi:putative ammonium transporter 1 isoform X2 [Neocloeon triangulifer]|uniref:putative ammonium transporter 1 isoform X2 n=1 Tax=Neocloeon triangulifer TaxID=2078957 RepID=UPI00286FA056|nr:putative ammonium transporter 1 isoform X2 [Neocloeon triangulifer]
MEVLSRNDSSSASNASFKREDPLVDFKRNVDDFFLITNSIVICLMQCGFACLEAGSVRAKNATNIMMKNMMDMFICGACYWLIGYSLAFGTGSPLVGIGDYVAGRGLAAGALFSHWFFQFTFAATAATIVSGAVAERCTFASYLTYSAVISGIVYPVASHWAWSDEGWLSKLGYKDFAGSGVVHLLGGVCAFVGALLLGPRTGRFDNKTPQNETFAGHSTPLVGVGAMILFTGFLAFNGGSLGHISHHGDGELVAKVLANTALGGAGGALVTMALGRAGLAGQAGKWSFLISLNGALTGMVSVCASADQLQLWASIFLGAIAGPIYCFVSQALVRFKVHGGGGVWGLLGGAILRSDTVVAGDFGLAGLLIGYNLVGVLAIAAWAGGTCCILFGLLRRGNLLRVSQEEELEGMDRTKHSEPAYPGPPWHVKNNANAGEVFRNQAFVSEE